MVGGSGESAWRQRYADARAKLVDVGPDADAPDGVVGLLQTLCRSLSVNLDMTGAAVNLMSAAGSDGVAAASDERSRAVDELQFTANEGPCHDSFAARRPVLTPDLGALKGRWPGYTEAAMSEGVQAVFAFPLFIGAVALGVLDVYSDEPGSLSPQQVAIALTFAQIATEILLDGDLVSPGGDLDPALSIALDQRSEIYQAQGMVMVDIEANPADALARMRAFAFAHERPMIDLARDIIGGYALRVNDGTI